MFGPNIKIQGCFYHLTQNILRKLQTLGLQTEYKENEEFNLFCSSISVLAFLKVDDVRNGMRYLRGIAPPLGQELLDYFHSTYVMGTYKRANNVHGRITLKRKKKQSILLKPGMPEKIPLQILKKQTIKQKDGTNALKI